AWGGWGDRSGAERSRPADRAGDGRHLTRPSERERSPRPGSAPRRIPGSVPPAGNETDVARREKVRVIPVGASPTRLTQSLQPEAIGAAAEVTKPPKPPRQRAATAARGAGRP